MKKTLFALFAAIACCGTAVSADDPNSPPDSLIFGDVTLVLTEVTLGTTNETTVEDLNWMRVTFKNAGSTTATAVASSSAMAGNYGSLNWNGTTTLSSYTIDFTLSAVQAAGAGNAVFLTAGNGNKSTAQGLGITITSNGVFAFSRGAGNILTGTGATTSIAAVAKHQYRLTYDGSNSIFYLMDRTDEDNVLTATCTLSNDDKGAAPKNFVSGTTFVWTNGKQNGMENVLIADLSGVSKEDIATIARTPALPEPATATLSLLALAGLAARRRRK